jgi:hypothetical protein
MNTDGSARSSDRRFSMKWTPHPREYELVPFNRYAPPISHQTPNEYVIPYSMSGAFRTS